MLSTGLQILVLVDQLIGQQIKELVVAGVPRLHQTKELVTGVPTFRTLLGNLIAKLLCEHIDPLCFIHYLFVPPAVRVQICM